MYAESAYYIKTVWSNMKWTSAHGTECFCVRKIKNGSERQSKLYTLESEHGTEMQLK